MSFFDTEEAHAGVLAYGKDEGGRAAPKAAPTSLGVKVFGGDGRPPGSAVESRLRAPA